MTSKLNCYRGCRPIAYVVVLFLIIILVQPGIAGDKSGKPGNSGTWVNEIDTTKSRDVKPASKSFIQVVTEVPGFVLQAPFRLLGYTTKGIVYAVYQTPLRRLTSLGNPISPFSVIAGYGSNSGFKGGIGYRFRNIFAPANRFTLKTYYSSHEYQSYQIKFQAPDLLSESTDFYFETRYRKRPWESFYGIGMSSRTSDEVAYTLEHTIATGTIRKAFGSRTHFSLLGSYTATNIFDDQNESLVGDVDSIQVLFNLTPDHFRATRYISVGVLFEMNWRDHIGQPSQGGMISLAATYSYGVGRSDDLRFIDLKSEISKFINIWRKRVLAFRILAERHDNITDNRVTPFYLRSSLGGIENLRGY